MMRARLLVLVAMLLALLAPLPLGNAAEPRSTAAGFRNPVKEVGSDPQLFVHNGTYHLTYTRNDRIAISRATSVTDLATVPETTVWQDSTASRCCGIWAPEFHFLNGRWYGYYTATDSANTLANHRVHVIESAGADPMGPYAYRGQLAAAANHYSLDASILSMPDGRIYALWSGWEPGTQGPQNLYVAPLSNPWTTSGPRVLLSRPQFAWEMDHAAVNEGAAALWRNGRLFLAYSASGCTSPNYALGLLTFNGGDVLNPAAWSKSPQPVFRSAPANTAYTTAHNSFFTSPDGSETWMAYHGVVNPAGSCGGDRTTRIQKVTWRADGTPDFGVPASLNHTLALPAGDPGAVGVPAGEYVLTTSHSGKALDVAGPSTADGADVIQWTYHGGTNQQWQLIPQTDGSYDLRALHSGKSLDVAESGNVDGADVVQWTSNGGANQRWYLDAVPGGLYRISSKVGGRALDIDHGLTTDGANALVWQYLVAPNQKWRLSPVQRVMPLGDSITYGSSAGATYRTELWRRLVAAPDVKPDFVGSVVTGNVPDQQHEGHPGWRIDQLAANIDGWLDTYRPDVVMLHIGTNDMNQNFDVARAPDRLASLVDQITARSPSTSVIVASIIPAADAAIESRIRTYNAAIPGIVQARASAGKRVSYVDMHAVLGPADLADTLHPNDAGYQKMGVAWQGAMASLQR